MITRDKLLEYVYFEDGELRWRVSGRYREFGDSLDKGSSIYIDNTRYTYVGLLWLYYYGKYTTEIDFLDSDRTNFSKDNMFARNDIIDQEEVRKYFRYEDGKLFWKIKPMKSKYELGSEAGHIHKSTGYKKIKFKGKYLQTHRLVWLYFNDHLPEYIDHIDRNRLNNKIENLRAATVAQNTANTINLKNTSGYRGVKKRSDRSYEASIKVEGRYIYLGTFKTGDEAADAYDRAAVEYHKEFAILNNRRLTGGE